ncbi:MAG: ribosome-associated translation inhibitor RaiA [Pseudomonadota bacterium]
MQFSITGRHLDVGQALRSHVEQGLDDAVSKYFDNAMDSNVVFSKTGAFFQADISVHVGRGILIQGRAEADDPYVAFNSAVEHIAKRLRRHKRRLRDHHKISSKEKDGTPAQQYVIAGGDDATEIEGEEGSEPVVIAEMTMDIESLTVGEAVMRMDLADAPAIMFRNSAHGGLNMIYRRPDGNVGWVDPRGNREKLS